MCWCSWIHIKNVASFFPFFVQGTMPSSLKHPSHIPMWRGVRVAYVIIALCLYPIAIGGFYAYGNRVRSTSNLHSSKIKFSFVKSRMAKLI